MEAQPPFLLIPMGSFWAWFVRVTKMSGKSGRNGFSVVGFLFSESLLVFLPSLAFAFSIPITAIMFIGASMTLYAIVDCADAFLNVLVTDACGRVLMATVASVATVVVEQMTGHTAGIMIAVQGKILVVIEARRQPLFLRVALGASAGNLLVQRVGW